MQVSSMAYSAAVNACSAAKGSRWPWIVTLPATKTSENGAGKTSFLLGLFQGLRSFPEVQPGNIFWVCFVTLRNMEVSKGQELGPKMNTFFQRQ